MNVCCNFKRLIDPIEIEETIFTAFFPFVFSMRDGTRYSVQRAYVYPASRRPNLTVRPYSTATKVRLTFSVDNFH